MPKIVIGLVGPIASGKGEVVKILVAKGYRPYSLSDRIREEITQRGLEVNRTNLNFVSNNLRQNFGADILAKRTSELIEKGEDELAVIDAIRNPFEIKYLQNKFGAKIIGVVADQKRRFELFLKRGTNIAGIETWEQFKELDNRELAQEGIHKQQVKACLNLADIVIENNGTVEDLRANVEDFIRSLDKI